MEKWAEREIEIACKKENPNKKEGEFDYGCACYESALKAFKSLCEDGHSGMSMSITKSILNNLIDGKPLTPIEDTEDVWIYITDEDNGVKLYQSNRMYSLFKGVHTDGKVEYNDVDRVVCVNVHNKYSTYHSGLVSKIINEMYPIVMPYHPHTIKVFCEDFLVDEKEGDFDTVGVFKMTAPFGDADINKFYKLIGNDFEEITREEYNERKKVKIKGGE